jgi:CBS domain-containing protein/PII-like signaling protein
MQIQGQALRVTIYIGEADQYHGKPLYMAILEFLKKNGASGATVTRGLAGFGAHSRIHTATIVTLSADLPIKLEWIDVAERVERLLPEVRHMVNDGLITLEELQVVQYAPGRQPNPLDQPVSNIMRDEVVTVSPDTPVEKVTNLLLERGYRSLPIVDQEQRLLGIITSGDLLRKAGLISRLPLQETLAPEDIQAQWAEMRHKSLVAADIMTRQVITVRFDESVRTAVTRMAEHELKRLPVIDDRGRLVGLVSRVDVLRAIEYHQPLRAVEPVTPHSGHSVADLMHTDVPTVRPDTPLEQVIETLEKNQRRRAIVTDEEGHVLGIITDGDLLRRSGRERRPDLAQRLRNLLTGQREEPSPLPAGDETAAQLMTSPVITVTPQTTLTDALRLMLQHQIKRLPVVDEENRLLGLLGRASLLQGLLEAGEQTD